jgi:chromosome partitioning protein
MKTITLANEKGGVGKTTLAIHIAAGLAIKGLRVVLIDADAQGHATFGLGLNKAPGFYDLLVRNAPWKDVLKAIAPEVYELPSEKTSGALFVLPGNGETALIAQKLDNALLLEARLRELAGYVDVVIFDTSPSPSLLHGVIYMATDAMLYPTTCEAYSLQALVSTVSNIAVFSTQREQITKRGIESLGMVPMMYRPNTVEHSENLKSLQERFGEQVWDALPQRITWSEAANLRRPVFSYAPESNATREALHMVDGVMAYAQQT